MQTINQSFIANVFTNLSEKKTVNGDIARYILKQAGNDELEQTLVAFATLQRMREDSNRKMRELGTEGDEPPFKPERLLSFVQSVMNGVCWAARRLHKANERPEYGNGQDFSQEVAQDVGVYCTNEHIPEFVDDDFMALNAVHSILSSKMDYLTDIQPLYHFEQRTRDDDGNWYVDKVCTSFDDALPLMDEIIERLQAEKQESEVSDMLAQLRAARAA
jgi:hypothetical protein